MLNQGGARFNKQQASKKLKPKPLKDKATTGPNDWVVGNALNGRQVSKQLRLVDPKH